ncbi:hypothetical protein TPR58_04220 [Sphingomonas sp. HF-S3]|uniref:Uncharacterized protein n=1 Tax=Sphingomonas rustica TaxID=3103142 RepID=A0ABV0B580_9SPHN
MMLENRRDAAVARREELLARIAAVEDGRKRSRPFFIGETEADTHENLLYTMRQCLRDEELAIETMNEDLSRL